LQIKTLTLPGSTSLFKETATECVQGVIEGKVVELVAFCCAGDIMIVDKAATVEILCVVSLGSLQIFEIFCKGGGVIYFETPSS